MATCSVVLSSTTEILSSGIDSDSRLSEDEIILRCSYPGCKKKFSKPSHLKQHEVIHSGLKPFLCTHEGCSKAFNRPYHLKRHQLIHSGVKSFECPDPGCKAKFALSSSLRKHSQRSHQDNFKCSVPDCDAAFKKHKALLHHEAAHRGEKLYKCTEEDCTNSYTTKSKLKKHLFSHQEGYVCSDVFCRSTFKSWTDLLKHVRKKHQNKECELCGRFFSSSNSLQKHAYTHSSNRETYTCPIDGCNKLYCSRNSMKEHVKTHHEGQRPFPCPKQNCGSAFTCKGNLKRHLSRHDLIIAKRSKMTENAANRRQKKAELAKKFEERLARMIAGQSPEEINRECGEYMSAENTSETFKFPNQDTAIDHSIILSPAGIPSNNLNNYESIEGSSKDDLL